MMALQIIQILMYHLRMITNSVCANTGGVNGWGRRIEELALRIFFETYSLVYVLSQRSEPDSFMYTLKP